MVFRRMKWLNSLIVLVVALSARRGAGARPGGAISATTRSAERSAGGSRRSRISFRREVRDGRAVILSTHAFVGGGTDENPARLLLWDLVTGTTRALNPGASFGPPMRQALELFPRTPQGSLTHRLSGSGRLDAATIKSEPHRHQT